MNWRAPTKARDVPSGPAATRCSNLIRDWIAAPTTASIEVRPSQNIEIRTSADVGSGIVGRSAPVDEDPVGTVSIAFSLPHPRSARRSWQAYDAARAAD